VEGGEEGVEGEVKPRCASSSLLSLSSSSASGSDRGDHDDQDLDVRGDTAHTYIEHICIEHTQYTYHRERVCSDMTRGQAVA
jgi:hypothetical protein